MNIQYWVIISIHKTYINSLKHFYKQYYCDLLFGFQGTPFSAICVHILQNLNCRDKVVTTVRLKTCSFINKDLTSTIV